MTKSNSAADESGADQDLSLLTEASPEADDTPPTYVKLGETPDDICARVRIIDVETEKRIDKVIEADAEQGRVVRYVVDKGALVIENNRFKTVEEERQIRIEWAAGNQKVSF